MLVTGTVMVREGPSPAATSASLWVNIAACWAPSSHRIPLLIVSFSCKATGLPY